MSTYTPGPWIVYKGAMNMNGGLNPFFRGIVALLKHSGEDDDVCVILDRNEEAHDYEANARLIAAAPDLLDVLRQYTANDDALDAGLPFDTYTKEYNRIYALAKAAIAKATV